MLRREPRVRRELAERRARAELREHRVGADADVDLAVARREHAVGGEEGEAAAELAGQVAGAGVVGDEVADQVQRGVVQRGLDALADAGAVAHAQREHDAERGVGAGDRSIAEGPIRTDGRPGSPVMLMWPGERLQQLVVARLLAQRPGLAEARDAAVDEAGPAAPKLLVADPEPVGDAGLEALDDDVGAAHERARPWRRRPRTSGRR